MLDIWEAVRGGGCATNVRDHWSRLYMNP